MSKTPILDLERDPPARKPLSTFGWIVSVCVGLAIDFWIFSGGIQHPRTAALDVLVFVLTYYVSTAIQDFGLVLGAKVVGFEVKAVTIGGLVVSRSLGRWAFKFERGSLIGGSVFTLTKPGKCSRARFIIYLAAGPIVSIMFALAAWMYLLSQGNGTSDWIATMSLCATFFAIVSLLPSTRTLNRSTISSLWHLLFDKERARSWLAVKQLLAANAAGVRPRDWDSEVFQLMLAHRGTDPEHAYRNLLAFYRRVDEGDRAASVCHLEWSLEYSSELSGKLRKLVFYEAAFTNAIWRRNPSQARVWLRRGDEIGKPESTAVEAAIAICEARYADALKFFAEARGQAEKLQLDSGLARFVYAKWAEFEAECRTALESESRLAGGDGILDSACIRDN